MIPAILLAAGQASRYGRPKLLEPFQGETLLRRAARTLRGAGCDPLIVVVAPSQALRAEVDDLHPILVENPSHALGISHSIALGVEALPAGAEAVLIAVADQPLVSEDVIRALLRAFEPGLIVAPRYGADRGNPRVYDRRFFAELSELQGDRGAQTLADRHPEAVREVALAERHGLDIDTPDDWRKLAR
ncbi:MAG TPA: nucleotidyltransferase family protein [Candidatus Limnocylindrales bacterium]|nr:nucleotidyltransferase family protein [Candidatus Limnocylindrales bacterium]